VFFWCEETNVKPHFIQPDKSTRVGFVESFNARLRDNCLNQYWFRDLRETTQLIEQWRIHYNEVLPHSSLKQLPPSVFTQKAA
jgi:putative transposase